ncbi:Lrp/AsnC family transcriptional regulator, leucine-responsive regulatory protein [Cohaesibacter marisflavi]|uniref:Lrp/AsnC family transcriptional regulator, leucine-responsive regulatory protein n=1 Tax=Cohaesibacter marisflavi TaxID=655353 RepID=A0A1I5A6P0_9HYPH|nr:Lrp/AsnC family transcriptional regulator [Cohaesibacter marisflavi]SFN58104.1 Lrp/AsnC family transcriptional regulator, leucine-responsive regulatory protein [Cohaesibacter marisflavi]
MMDETDRRLLALLQKDGRRASADLAKVIGLSVSATNDRVRKLIDSGAVRSIEAIVEPSTVGFGVTAFIYVDLDYGCSEEEFVSEVTAIDKVLEVHHVTGTHSYLLKVRERTNQELNAFMATQLKRLPGVKRTETLISLETLKETLSLPF